ncbi:hypothetical protein LEP1GSC103_3225 [Leptospira borgpetersenii serovar Javanica str. UI 09931]|nr:hypothetical protein LEP1GSC128_2856 [Leptospira borgpetersenii str. 200801926]EKQ90723.1 hypothetical protein LEP1GSC101_0661 [Leptospira borgpetersenii str. UI 09149]EKR00251.1 hypothetical protein LEP1GSC121_3792 [Leptospira borgpetersenii serovar Castellonis str. 200801910]EMK14856.1 hypothetical protein LEP1GSC066_0991 [Leptospira sp. serovar Kenya str. Sh9]EMN11356.1 hypothetical protein LEP1GSC055_2687 [Leptospira borgpetersenii str. Brem 307]EMN19247.1 hypothetical protein LEP1GSC05
MNGCFFSNPLPFESFFPFGSIQAKPFYPKAYLKNTLLSLLKIPIPTLPRYF